MRCPTPPLLVRSLFLALCGPVPLLPAAWAQTTPGGDAALDTVIVTGTRARDRTELTTPVPVDILTQDDLRRAAGPGGELGAALQTLLPSFNQPRQSNSGGADHVRAAQLRGLSPDQVLVLVNGKRRHTSAIVNLESKVGKGTNPVDFNSIPVGAIKRIEVLRDGAGAQYGSDAIAGVINIILDDAASGGELAGTYGFYDTDFKPTGQRIRDGYDREVQGEYGLPLGSGGFIRFGADASKRDATNRGGAGDLPFFENQSAQNLALAGQRLFRPGDPELKNGNLWFNGALPTGWLGDDTTAYAFGTFNHRKTVGAAFFRYPDSSANDPTIYPNGYRPETTGTNEDLALAGGLKGGLGSALGGAARFDASLSYGRNHFDYGVRNSLNASLGPDSPTTFRLGVFESDQLTANLDLLRELALAGPQPWTLAFGAEVRRDGFRTQAGDPASYAIGPLAQPAGAQAGPGLQASDAAKVSRNVGGVYVDLAGALTPALYAGAAARFDHYEDFGNALTGKLSGRLALTPTIALRGAVSNNFRAPSLAQESFSFTVTDRGTGGQLSQVRTLPVDSPIARALGAQDLKAEKSRDLSLGLTAQPFSRVALSLDAYQVKVDNRITLSERFSGTGLSAFLQTQFPIAGAGIDALNFFTNAVDTTTRGVDLVASWQQNAGPNGLRLTGAATWVRTTIRNIRATPAPLATLADAGSLVGLEEQNTLTTAAPRRREVWTTQWSDAKWGLLGRLTRQGGTTRVFDFGGGFTPTQTYQSKLQLDLEVEYRFTAQLALALGGTNVTDTYPTRSIDDIAYFGHLPYDVLSPVGFNGAFYYARLKFTF